MGFVYVVTSGKGGVGKTTTTANLGAGLARLGRQVCMLDTDIGLRNLDVVLGLENRIVYDIVDVVQGKCRLKQALIRDKRFDNMFLLPAAQTKDKTAISEQQMINLIANLKPEFDYIIIDCPAGIEHGFKNAVAGADKAIVVTAPEVSAVRDADRIIGLLEAHGLGEPHLIINRIRPRMVQSGDMMSVEDMLEILAVELLGIVPDDDSIVTSTNRGEPAVLDDCSKAGQAYRNITRRLCGEAVPLLDLTEKDGFFSRLKSILVGR